MEGLSRTSGGVYLLRRQTLVAALCGRVWNAGTSADFRRQNVPDVVGGLCAKDIAQALCAFEPVRVEAVVGWVVGFFAVADEVYSWMVGCCGEDG